MITYYYDFKPRFDAKVKTSLEARGDFEALVILGDLLRHITIVYRLNEYDQHVIIFSEEQFGDIMFDIARKVYND